MALNEASHLWKDKTLYTPGPLTTSLSVKQAMLRDLGSRDKSFIDTVKRIRVKILELADIDRSLYTVILMQGSGTYGIEAVLSSVIPHDGKLLVYSNGHYGERIEHIAKIHRINTKIIRTHEYERLEANNIDAYLNDYPDITHVSFVHCETSTGIINPIDELCEVINQHQKILIIDAMSSFGAVPINFNNKAIDFLISSSNKCIEGVPGFSFIIAKKSTLLNAQNTARTLSLDIYSQWQNMEKDGQFRFTPPTHAILAFEQALKELELEGGIESRSNRYKQNHQTLINGMIRLGFKPFLEPDKQGYIITSFLYPENPNFQFENFYQLLNQKGFVIYPGKISQAPCFRIGNIGRLNQYDMLALISAIEQTLVAMGIDNKE